MIYKILLFIGILLGVIAQLVMKGGMHSHGKKHGKVKLSFRSIHRDILRIYLNLYVFIGVFLYLLAFFIWLFILSKMDLSYAYPLVSINFVLVALFSKIFFKETVSRKRWMGIAVIMIGVILVSMS